MLLKQKKRSHKKKKFILTISLLVILFIAAAVCFYLTSKKETIVKQQEQAGKDIKDRSISRETSDGKSKKLDGDRVPQPSPEAGHKDTVNITISAANQTDSLLQIRVLIPVIDTNGTCHLKISKDGSNIERTTNTSHFASTATCQGFDIPLQDLSPGQWDISVNYEGELSVGNVNQTVEIR